MANVAYIRVSTVEQNEDCQLENLKQYQINRIFSGKVSAKDTKRPQLQEMLRYDKGVYIHRDLPWLNPLLLSFPCSLCFKSDGTGIYFSAVS